MPVVWRGGGDGINVLLFQHLADVLVGRHPVAFPGQFGHLPVQHGAIGIA